MRRGIVWIVALTLALAGTAIEPAAATTLVRAAGAGTMRQGLDFAIAGKGLSVTGNGTINVTGINGTIEEAYLFWGGALQGVGEPHDTLIFGGSPVVGSSIGSEDLPTLRTSYAYTADVTATFKGIAPAGGTLSVAVADPLHGDPLSGLDGVSLLVIFRNPADQAFHEIQVFRGCDYAWADFLPGPAGSATPVQFQYGSSTNARATRVALVVGDASIARPDRVRVTGNIDVLNQLNGSDGPQWDTDVYPVTLPAGSTSVQAEPISPPDQGQLADALQWVAAVLRVSCEGTIGNRIWHDVNENGIQDAGEPGIADVDVTLSIVPKGVPIEIATTTTDANGAYEFVGVCAGAYMITVDETDLPADFVETLPFAGNDPELDSDCAGGAAFVVMETDGDQRSDIDCGFHEGSTFDFGACCLPDGGCQTAADEDECSALGGLFQGAFTKCSGVTCPPAGACCFSDGSCVAPLIQFACVAAGGSWQGAGSTCGTAACPQPEGACCLPDGSCTLLTAASCGTAGGLFQGNFVACGSVSCPQPSAACCLPDGSCATLTDAACMAQGGTWQGFGSSCGSVACPQPIAACCLPDGTCSAIEQAACTAAGGTWQGMGSDCAGVACDQPIAACCLPDGSCLMLEESACTAQGGDWQGMGVSCVDITCIQPSAACCLPDGSCVTVTDAACTAQGGTWQGFGSDCETAICPQPIAACCLPVGDCVDLDAADCAAAGGAWNGMGTSCASISCPQPVAACCLPDGTCTKANEADCIAMGGTWPGFGVECETATCPQPDAACCLPDGSCLDVTESACIGLGGSWQGFGSDCASIDCDQPMGACCLPNGDCLNVTEAACLGQGGDWNGMGSDCATTSCPQPIAACCLPDGACVELTESDCTLGGGAWEGFGTDCTTTICPQPSAACCLPDGSCVDVTAADCAAQGGNWEGFGSACASTSCPQPSAACCLASGACIETTDADCTAQGGTWEGFGSACATTACPQPIGACCFADGSCQTLEAPDCAIAGGSWQGDGTLCPQACVEAPPRAGGTEKGSLLIWPSIEVRWDRDGKVLQDVFLQLTNDFPEDVRVLMYFVNGDAPLKAGGIERPHPGWNNVDNEMILTANQPRWWSVSDGQPIGLSPWSVLDPGDPPGRPDPEGSDDRVLRGFIAAWAVGDDGEPIRWNHLAGGLVTVNYAKSFAWEASPIAAQVVDPTVAHGTSVGTPGTVKMDGLSYSQLPSLLMLEFRAEGSTAYSGPATIVAGRTDLTLMPMDADLRSGGDGPVTTKVHADVWNENEVKLSGSYRCITCWDQALLGAYGVPNHFMLWSLQTDAGKARIDGIQSALCPGSAATPLLGVAVRRYSFDGAASTEATAVPLVGMGYESATIRYDAVGPPPEAPRGGL